MKAYETEEKRVAVKIEQRYPFSNGDIFSLQSFSCSPSAVFVCIGAAASSLNVMFFQRSYSFTRGAMDPSTLHPLQKVLVVELD